ncbi:MAG: LysR substrate-binding domain-containing protein [Tagaea sp.]|nr:LysR substrate-binding domain-containing protein [Tagaea sp.]
MKSEVNPMSLTLRQLRAFAAVARLGGFTAAAKRLHLTQSALSGLVRDLEANLGVRLFDRTTRAVALTAAGRDFLPLASRVLDDIQDAATRISGVARGDLGVVRVAAMELMSSTLLPPIVARFERANPGVEVRVSDAVLERVLERVRLGEVDLGIGPEPAPDPELDRTPLLTAPFLFVCPRGHRLARKRTVAWRDFAGERFITMIRNLRDRILADPQGWSEDLDPARIREVALLTTALGMVRAGLGVSACPSYGLPLVRGFGLVARPLVSPALDVELFVFTRKGRGLSPAARRFVAALRGDLEGAGHDIKVDARAT